MLASGHVALPGMMLCAAGHVTAIAYIQGISIEITADQYSRQGAVQKKDVHKETSARNVAADQEVM